MAVKIITDPTKLERDQVVRPSLDQLEEAARITFEQAINMSRQVRKTKALEDTDYYRKFIAACLESMSYKLFAVKRLGRNYIPEAGAILRVHTEITVDFWWLVAHYKNQKEHANLLSKQFFFFLISSFLIKLI